MTDNQGMPSTPSSELWPSTPGWFRWIPVLDKGTLVVSALAAAVELFRALSLGPNVGALAALVVTITGVVVSRFRAWPGLLLVAAGSVTAALMFWDPNVPWTIAVFTLFSVTVGAWLGSPPA